jgi:biopolymer transport protein TolR
MFRDRFMTMTGSLEPTMVNVSPRRRSRFRSNYLICHIDVTAFLAIMIAVLYLFMLPPASYRDLRPVAVDLPKVKHPDLMGAANREDALIVAVMRDGKVFFRADPVVIEELPARVHQAVVRGAENKVYIRADARAKLASVKDVLDALQASGVENIAFLTEQRHPPAQ